MKWEKRVLLSATMTPLYLHVPVSHNIKIKSTVKLKQPVGLRPICFIAYTCDISTYLP